MPLTLICRRCSTESVIGDRFCQECGFELKPAENSNEGKAPQKGTRFDFSPSGVNKYEWPALEDDPAENQPKAFSTPAFERKFSRYKDKQVFGPGEFDPNKIDAEADAAEAADFVGEQAFTSTSSAEGSISSAEASAAIALNVIAETLQAEIPVNEPETARSSATPVVEIQEIAAQTPSEGSGAASPVMAEQNRPAESSEEQIDTAEASIQKLHSPLLAKAETKTKDSSGMRGGIHVVLMDAGAIIAVLAFAGALGFWGYNSYQSSQKVAKEKLAASAQISSQKDEYAATYKSLFALNIISPNGLDDKQQAAFDEAAYRLGQKAMDAGQKVEAEEYFKNVSLSSQHYVRAQEILFRMNAPVTEEQPLPLKQPAPAARPVEAVSSQQPSLSENRVLSIPEIPEISNPSKQAKDDDEAATGAESSSPTSGETGSAGAEGTAAPETAPAEAPIPKFSESEVSKYNHMLGSYFSKHQGQHETGTEPPSFKEWIRQGKPAF